jgi:hypothetical protein
MTSSLDAAETLSVGVEKVGIVRNKRLNAPATQKVDIAHEENRCYIALRIAQRPCFSSTLLALDVVDLASLIVILIMWWWIRWMTTDVFADNFVGIECLRSGLRVVYIFSMLSCSWCGRNFFDGELLTWRNDHGTEMPHHADCWAAWMKSRQEEAETFGHDFIAAAESGGIEFFERRYFTSQVS